MLGGGSVLGLNQAGKRWEPNQKKTRISVRLGEPVQILFEFPI